VAAMTWDRFLDAYSRPHLVVAWLHGRQRAGEERRLRLDDLKKAVMALKPCGDWAITNANPTEIYIASTNWPMRRNFVGWCAPGPSALALNGIRKRLFGSRCKPKDRSWMC
jgi:hypothetical protein